MRFKDQIDIKARFLVLPFDAKTRPFQFGRVLEALRRTMQGWIKRAENGEDARKIKKVDEGKIVLQLT